MSRTRDSRKRYAVRHRVDGEPVYEVYVVGNEDDPGIYSWSYCDETGRAGAFAVASARRDDLNLLDAGKRELAANFARNSFSRRTLLGRWVEAARSSLAPSSEEIPYKGFTEKESDEIDQMLDDLMKYCGTSTGGVDAYQENRT